MENSRMKKKPTKKMIDQSADRRANQETVRTAEVLYQKMGDRWFTFFLVDDEVFVGSTPDHLFDKDTKTHLEKKSRLKRLTFANESKK